MVDLKIRFVNIEFKRYDNITLKDDIQVEVPYFNTTKFNRDCSVVVGEWIVLGGGMFDPKKEMTTYYLLRVTEK